MPSRYGFPNPLRGLLIFTSLLSLASLSAQGPSVVARRWSRHVEHLAHDDLGGREAGTAGHRHAAEYVAKELRSAGLRPATPDTKFLQPVSLLARQIDLDNSSVTIRLPDRNLSLQIGEDIVLLPAGGPALSLQAGLVFGGYGIDIPGTDYSDLNDLADDAVVLSVFGWPRDAPQPAAAHGALFDGQAAALQRHGARGVLATVPQPWEKTKNQFGELDMDLADPEIALFRGIELWGLLNPKVLPKVLGADEWERATKSLSQGERLDRYPLNGELRAEVVFRDQRRISHNVVGVAPGAETGETHGYVVVVAHLDAYGIEESETGDRIYNGAMDNAAGVATLIEAARLVAERSEPLERSILFLITTAEEKGMLGARSFLESGIVPAERIAAVLTIDTPLPLRPLTEVWGWGLTEAGLGKAAEKVGARFGLEVDSNPPGRSLFAMGDQLVFALAGHPTALLGFGYPGSTAALRREFFATRSHNPLDQFDDSIDFQAAAAFSRYVADLSVFIANLNDPPQPMEGYPFGAR